MTNLKTLKCLYHIVQRRIPVVPLKIRKNEKYDSWYFCLYRSSLAPAGPTDLPLQASISFCRSRLDPLFQDTTENFLEEGRLMVPSALDMSQDSEDTYLAFKVFPCLLEQAAIQVLTDNTTAMFCKDWSFVPVTAFNFLAIIFCYEAQYLLNFIPSPDLWWTTSTARVCTAYEPYHCMCISALYLSRTINRKKCWGKDKSIFSPFFLKPISS